MPLIPALPALPLIPQAALIKGAVIAFVIAAFGATMWFKGYVKGANKLVEYQAKQAVEAVRIAKAREVVTTKVVKEYVIKREKAKVVERVIEKEVVKYAERNTGSCLDAEWRVLHDNAAAGTVPEAGSSADGAAGAPTAAAAIETVTGNYAACRRTAARLTALQQWVVEQLGVE